MFPFHIRLGPFGISPVELFAVAGIVLAGFLARRKMSPQPSWNGMADLLLAALLGGAAGARMFYFVPLWLRGLEPLGKLFTDWSHGSGYIGGLVGGTAAVLTVARFKKLSVRNVADAVGQHIPLGFAVGKVGCFIAGCCYGRRCEGFPGVTFASGSLAAETQRSAGEIAPAAARSLPVHPTQLYEFGLGILLYLGLTLLQRRSKRPGEVYLAYVVGYSIWRFVVEYFRSDPGRFTFGASSLSDSQISSIVLGLVAGGLWALLRARKPEGEAPPTPK